MTWVRFEDNFAEHPKVKPLADGAYRMWTTMIAYSNRFGLNGVITRKQIDDECRHIRARNRHIWSLIRAPLLHELDATGARLEHDADTTRAQPEHDTDTKFWIHDIGDYQPTVAKSADLSQKRSDAGKKGAAARWKTDGNLPLANNAPVPSRPVPTRDDHDPLPSEEEKIDSLDELQRAGCSDPHNWRWLNGGPRGDEVRKGLGKLLPITRRDFDRIAELTDTRAARPNFGFFLACLENERKASEPIPLTGGAALLLDMQAKGFPSDYS